jgi:hypothetical protein
LQREDFVQGGQVAGIVEADDWAAGSRGSERGYQMSEAEEAWRVFQLLRSLSDTLWEWL